MQVLLLVDDGDVSKLNEEALGALCRTEVGRFDDLVVRSGNPRLATWERRVLFAYLNAKLKGRLDEAPGPSDLPERGEDGEA